MARFNWFSVLCSGDNVQEQYERCDIENWGHFVPASWRTNSNQMNFMQHVAGTKFCPRNTTGMSQCVPALTPALDTSTKGCLRYYGQNIWSKIFHSFAWNKTCIGSTALLSIYSLFTWDCFPLWVQLLYVSYLNLDVSYWYVSIM